MPTIRGRFIPDREKSRAVKRSFDILLWIENITRSDFVYLDALEQLRIYLTSRHKGVCELRLIVPSNFADTRNLLSSLSITFTVVAPLLQDVTHPVGSQSLSDPNVSELATLAKLTAVDCVVVPRESPILSFIGDFLDTLKICLSDTSFLLRLSEFYVRGFDIPWTYELMIWDGTWTTFYQIAEPSTFVDPMNLLYALANSGCSAETGETGRSLVHNRLPQLCFSSDRLVWLELQRAAADRDGFTNQKYAFEISYHLNLYYLMLSGTFDHLALLVNGVYSLGLADRQVGATYKHFLKALTVKSLEMYAVFTKTATLDLIERLGTLRNLAAHRGSIAPSKIVEKPDREPTIEELDAHIRESGQGWMFQNPSDVRARQLVKLARQNARIKIVEKNEVANDVVFIEYKGKTVLISPLLDTTWNFQRVLAVFLEVIQECSRHIEKIQKG